MIVTNLLDNSVEFVILLQVLCTNWGDCFCNPPLNQTIISRGVQGMIFPPGEILHTNLFTSYLNINELISNLAADEFTGYIEVKFWDYQGIIFFDAGNPVVAIH